MAVYYKNIEFERSARDNLKFRLKIEESPVIPSNTSKLAVTVEYCNTSGTVITNYTYRLKLTVNGEVKVNKDLKFNVQITSSDEYKQHTASKESFEYLHTDSGGGSFTVSAEIKADEVLGYYRTVGSCSLVQSYTPIDQTLPVINAFAVTGNRYGRDVKLNLDISHASLPVTATLELTGLTYEQAVGHSNLSYQSAGAQVRSSLISSGGSYGVRYDIPDLSTSYSGEIVLDYIQGTVTEGKYYTSGKSYSAMLTVTAQNNKKTTWQSNLIIPQKVESIDFTESENLYLAVGNSLSPEYVITPQSSEETGVEFTSSDVGVASVNDFGVVTGISEGVCIITVTSKDRGVDGKTVFNDSLNIFVSENPNSFPQIKNINILGAAEISRIITATEWIADKLSVEITEVICNGRTHPPKDIKALFEKLEQNCFTLQTAAKSQGFTSSFSPSIRTISKSNTNWFSIVNGWIDFLNSLYIEINGGV